LEEYSEINRNIKEERDVKKQSCLKLYNSEETKENYKVKENRQISTLRMLVPPDLLFLSLLSLGRVCIRHQSTMLRESDMRVFALNFPESCNQSKELYSSCSKIE
jgi:hypothetical protein